MTITDARIGFLQSKEVKETIEEVKSFLSGNAAEKNDREVIERCANKIVVNAFLYLRRKQKPKKGIEQARELSKILSDFLDSDEQPEGWENWESMILSIMTYLPEPEKPRGRSNLGTERFHDDLVATMIKVLGKVPTQTQMGSLLQMLFGPKCTANTSRAVARANKNSAA